jgi:hypothetical protein
MSINGKRAAAWFVSSRRLAARAEFDWGPAEDYTLVEFPTMFAAFY